MVSRGVNSFLVLTAIITICYQFFFFVITALAKFDKITDFAGGSNFVVLALLTFIVAEAWNSIISLACTILVTMWGLRLSLFLLFRILSWGEDHRFDDKRNSILQLAAFWSIQAVWVWTVSLPLTFLNGTVATFNSSQESFPSSFSSPTAISLTTIGCLLSVVGLCIETIADFQKLFYKKREPSHWCDVGLWAYSRHPNYFGEICFWIGNYLSCLSVLSSQSVYIWLSSASSPLFIILILLFLSGMPILETQASQRYLSASPQVRQEFLDYKQQTSPLILCPQFVYRSLPKLIKIVFFLEFPIYNRHST